LKSRSSRRAGCIFFHPLTCSDVKGVTVITHPLVQHNLTGLRDLRTQPREFRRLLGEVAAMDSSRARGARHMRLVNLVASPEGIRRLRRHHSDLPIFNAAVNRRLHKRGYIVPGLGDASDSLFGV
jgi:uracil phosphoribosyltransferase